jgi:hypothetical protein
MAQLKPEKYKMTDIPSFTALLCAEECEADPVLPSVDSRSQRFETRLESRVPVNRTSASIYVRTKAIAHYTALKVATA